MDHEDCQPALGCVEQAGARTCRPRAQLGGACATDGRGAAPCVDSPCVKCVGGQCVAAGVQDSACQRDVDCRASFYCGSAGTCLFRVRRGETCQLTASADSRGNCLYPSDFCRITSGTTGVCTERPALGAPCGPGPGLTTNCAGNDTYCQFAPGDAGVCSLPPQANEACGTRPGLSRDCRTGFCDLDAGVCAAPLLTGLPCNPQSNTCATDLYCQRPPLPQVCSAKKATGQACSFDEQCGESLCDRVTRRCSLACSTTFDKEGASCQSGCPNGLRDGWIFLFFAMTVGPMSRRRRTEEVSPE
jgi:hypothetical protein